MSYITDVSNLDEIKKIVEEVVDSRIKSVKGNKHAFISVSIFRNKNNVNVSTFTF